MSHSKNTLLSIGFRDEGSWKLHGTQLLIEGRKAAEWRRLTAVRDVIYAFCEGKRVLYISGTEGTLSKKLRDYCAPTANGLDEFVQRGIRKLLKAGKEVRVLIFIEPALLSWGPFRINLSAGLEESLISTLKPQWNKSSSLPRSTS